MTVMSTDSTETAMFTLVMATDYNVAALSVVIAVTQMCTSLSQHCHYHCYHNAVLIFAATALCSFSLSQYCGHQCLAAVGFLLRTTQQKKIIILKGMHVHCLTQPKFYGVDNYKFIHVS